jgi:hypothetical protein
MSWSECSVEIGKTGVADAMAATLVSVGVIEDKSTTMQTAAGEKLIKKKSGGKIVAMAETEGEITITTKVVEPDFAFLATLIPATNDATAEELKVTSQLIEDNYSVKVTPKNIGGTGVRARKTRVSYQDGYDEANGHFATLTFTIIECADNELYTKFKKKAPVAP